MKNLWRHQDYILIWLLNKARKVNSMNCDARNDHVTIIDPLLGILCVGQYDKTGVQVGWILPIYEPLLQTTQEAILNGESVVCGDHELSSENITTSATLWMNLMETLVESLYRDSEDGNEIIYMSVHDATMDHSIGLKHVKNLYRSMGNEA